MYKSVCGGGGEGRKARKEREKSVQEWESNVGGEGVWACEGCRKCRCEGGKRRG